MCGRYAMDETTDRLIRDFVADGGVFDEWAPSFSVPPSTLAPIVRERGGDDGPTRLVEAARWGLKPSWAKDGGPSPINARLETIATNGMFRSALASARCVVPMSGYFEWEACEDGKQPHYLHAEDGGTLAAAGLYAARRDGDDWLLTFTIVTRTGEDAAGEVHDRMPVFLTTDVRDEWLAPGKLDDREGAVAMIDAASRELAGSIVSHPVSRRVNSVRGLDRSDATLIEPVEAE